jgi:outer membrane protein assembly factor BamB
VGASDSQILFSHVLRHVMPMVWMLFAFEISNTLMVTGSLGFLGYFIGGDVWIEVGDFVARRISGSPELGQMLATSYVNILEPWGMFAVGSVIFITVLGFNLVGEGIRRRLAYQRDVEQSWYGYIVSEIIPYIKNKISRPLLRWTKVHPFVSGLVTVVFVGLISLFIMWRIQTTTSVVVSMDLPDHFWASDWHDAYGSMRTDEIGPSQPDVLWTFEAEGTINGGVAVNKEGVLFFGDSSGTLYAVNPDGSMLWSYSITNEIIGTPALGAADRVYFSDREATLYAISTQGKLLWAYNPEIKRKPSSGPLVGPNGTLYSGFGSNLIAVDPKGELLWYSPVPYDVYENPPRLSADSEWLYYEEVIIDVEFGEVLQWPTMQDMDIALTGLDGKHYARSHNLVIEWEILEDDITVVQSAKWDSSAFTFTRPRYTGITQDGVIWMAYMTQRNPVVVWLTSEGNVINMRNTDRIERPVLIGLDGEDTAYMCGNKPVGTAACFALGKHTDEILWTAEFQPENDNQCKGGAISPGRVYVTLLEGGVVALGDK